MWLEVDPSSPSFLVTFASATGGTAVPAMSYLYVNNFQDPYKPRLFGTWLGSAYLAPRGESPSPYAVQDGWYWLPTQ